MMKVIACLLAIAAAHSAVALSYDEEATLLNGGYEDYAEDKLLDSFAEVLWDEEGFAVEDLHFFMDNENNARDLQAGSTYTDPSWWRAYKRLYARHFKRCKFLHNVAPVNGTSCRKMRHGDYTCMFDDQTCPQDGSIHPKIKCDCLGGDNDSTWNCEEYKACESTAATDSCPKNHPVTYNPPLACTGDFTCAVGKQTCCGQDFAKYDCKCTKNGGFDCANDRSCDGRVCPDPDECPVDPLNPDTPPEFGSSCSVAPEKSCAYGKICCCDDCIDETTCECVDGEWQCSTLAFRCALPCPPPINNDVCQAGDPVVEEGTFQCCENTLPVWVCTCTADAGAAGIYVCDLVNPPNIVCSCLAPPIIKIDPGPVIIIDPPPVDPGTNSGP